jgi:bifunctional non-homologous end joining protein LigD
MRRNEDGGRAQWLLIKHRDEFATSKFDVVAEVMTSVVSGRTMEEIAGRKGRVWNSNREENTTATKPARKKSARSTATARKKTTARRRRTTAR